MRPLSATDMRDALREVAERLQRAGVQGRLYVAGGAAMALAYDAERLTRDIDAAITHGHNAVIDAVRAVAAARLAQHLAQRAGHDLHAPDPRPAQPSCL